MKNNFQKIPLILSAICFVLLCIIFVFLYKKINSNNQKAQADTVVWQIEASRRDGIRSLENSLQQIAPDRALIETHFAKSSDIVPLLDMIEKFAPSVGAAAQINSVDIIGQNTALVVGLKATGNFESIYKFLTLLENSPYELDFLSMDLHELNAASVSTKNVKNIAWEATFKIQLLSFIP